MFIGEAEAARVNTSDTTLTFSAQANKPLIYRGLSRPLRALISRDQNRSVVFNRTQDAFRWCGFLALC